LNEQEGCSDLMENLGKSSSSPHEFVGRMVYNGLLQEKKKYSGDDVNLLHRLLTHDAANPSDLNKRMWMK
jgi:hypothetical protein